MIFEEAYQNLKEKFESGNDVPVTRAVITREEFEAIKAFRDDLLKFRGMLCHDR